jgi:hypothetical protein
MSPSATAHNSSIIYNNYIATNNYNSPAHNPSTIVQQTQPQHQPQPSLHPCNGLLRGTDRFEFVTISSPSGQDIVSKVLLIELLQSLCGPAPADGYWDPRVYIRRFH